MLTGQCDITTSNAVILTVYTLPTVSLGVAPYTKLFPGLSTTITANVVAASGATLSWYYNGILMPGVIGTTNVVSVTGLGTYQAKVVDANGCVNQSQVVTIADSASSRLFIYPSPNDGQFTVAYYNLGGASTQRSITVYDSHGAKVYNAQFAVTGPYQLLSIDIKRAQMGIYYVLVGDASGKRLAKGKVVVH
jgi:hypothetical protein